LNRLWLDPTVPGSSLKLDRTAKLNGSQIVQPEEEEIQGVLRRFPELGRAARGPQKRVRRKLTEAEKKVISDRMKASWAKRKRTMKVAS